MKCVNNFLHVKEIDFVDGEIVIELVDDAVALQREGLGVSLDGLVDFRGDLVFRGAYEALDVFDVIVIRVEVLHERGFTSEELLEFLLF